MSKGCSRGTIKSDLPYGARHLHVYIQQGTYIIYKTVVPTSKVTSYKLNHIHAGHRTQQHHTRRLETESDSNLKLTHASPVTVSKGGSPAYTENHRTGITHNQKDYL